MRNTDQQRVDDLKISSTLLEELHQLDVETFEVEDLVTLDQDHAGAVPLDGSSSSCSTSSTCSCSTSTSSCCSCSTSTS